MATASDPGPEYNSRFKPPSSDEEMLAVSKGFVPKNTQKSTTRALNVFIEWRAARNIAGKEHQCPEDLLENPVPERLNYWLSRFVNEARNQKGEPYPPRSLHQILAGLQRYMIEKSPNTPKFLDHNNSVYNQLHKTCDSVYRDLHSQGVGCYVNHAVPFSADE